MLEVYKMIVYNKNCKPKGKKMLGNRVKRAREASGFSLRDLGEQIGLSHAAIKKYEDNKVIPSSDILIKLAKALRVRVEYFFRPQHFTLESIQYRKHADMPEQHLAAITAKVLDHVERRVELESLFPSLLVYPFSVKSDKKINTLEEVELFADDLREQWRLGLDPIPDLIDMLEEQGIKVFMLDTQQYSKFDGLCTYLNGMPLIVIAEQSPGERQRFTLMHELGHIFLDNRIASHMDIENCCNRFAGAFLLPKESLQNVLGIHRNSIDPQELSLLKQEFGISMTSILHRAEEVGIISKSLYAYLRAEFKDKGWVKKEPGKPYPKQKTHIFEQMIFHALAEEYIGEAKAAELMNMSIESLRSMRAMESPDVGYY
jgi:Zn-dependent peptidase ImmA (M78 family)/DNA-binding XRE family transcriptional regulator